MEGDTLIIPFDCEDNFRWWSGGLRPHIIVELLSAPPDVIAQYKDANGSDAETINLD